MIFATQKQIKNVLQQQLQPKFSRNVSNYSNFANKLAICRNNTKTKNGQKLIKKLETRLGMIFSTKEQKECGYKKFVYQIRVKTLPII